MYSLFERSTRLLHLSERFTITSGSLPSSFRRWTSLGVWLGSDDDLWFRYIVITLFLRTFSVCSVLAWAVGAARVSVSLNLGVRVTLRCAASIGSESGSGSRDSHGLGWFAFDVIVELCVSQASDLGWLFSLFYQCTLSTARRTRPSPAQFRHLLERFC